MFVMLGHQVIVAILIIMAIYNILFFKGFGSSFLEDPKLQLNIRVQEKLPVKAIAIKVYLFIVLL